jgi:hypothetical protein
MQFAGASDLLYGSSNPVGDILIAVEKIWRLLFVKYELVSGNAIDATGGLGTKTAHSFRYLRWTVFLHLFLFLGIIWAAFRVVFLGGDSSRLNLQNRSFFLLLSWLTLLTAAYIFHYKIFGYYIDYFREFLPILVILFSAYVWETIFQESQGSASIYSSIIVVAGLAAIFITEKFVIELSKGILIVGVIGAAAVVMLRGAKQGRHSNKLAVLCVVVLASLYVLCRVIDMIPKDVALAFTAGGIVVITVWCTSNRLRYLNICLLLSSLVLSTTYAASTMDMRYDSIWSNEAVEKIAASIKEQSDSNDEVMSGAVIWEFESHRRPFAMISHPSTYRYGMPEEVTSEIEQEMKKRPPRIIVLDSYT